MDNVNRCPKKEHGDEKAKIEDAEKDDRQRDQERNKEERPMFSREIPVERGPGVCGIHMRPSDEESDHAIHEIPAGVVIPGKVQSEESEKAVKNGSRFICNIVGKKRDRYQERTQADKCQVPVSAPQP